MVAGRLLGARRTLRRVAVLFLGAIVGLMLAGFTSGLLGSPLNMGTRSGLLIVIACMMGGALAAVALFGKIFATPGA
jgi:hypothetical protein